MLTKSKQKDKSESFSPANRQGWREWLGQNHSSYEGIWLTIPKKDSGSPGVTLEDAVKEALCFGWVDSKLQAVDKESFKLMFTPRKTGSIWSRSNKQRVQELTKQGLMTAAGREKIEAAKRDGSWYRLDAIDDLRLPQDFREKLESNLEAKKNFDAFSNSIKKQILWWIESARKPETRQERIERAVVMALENKKPFPN